MNKTVRELFLLHVLNDGIRTTFVVLLPFIAKDLFLSFPYIGFLGSFQSFAGGLLALPAGFIAARIGGFHLLLTLLVIYSLGAFGVSMSPTILILTISFALGAIGFGMFHTVGFSLVASASDKTNIGRLMGDFTSVGELGRVGIPSVAIFLTAIIGWRETMLILGSVGFIMYIFMKFFSPSKDVYRLQRLENAENHRDFLKNTLLLFKIKKLLFIVLAGIIDSLASSPIYIFLPFLLLSKGITVSQLSIVMAAFFVGSFLGKSLLGRGVDKFGNVHVFGFSEVCMALTLVFLVSTSQFFIILILVFLLGSFTKGTSPVVQSMFSGLTHQMHYNKIYAVSEISIATAAVITGIVMGFVAAKFGITTVFYLCALLAVAAIFPLLPFIFGKKAL